MTSPHWNIRPGVAEYGGANAGSQWSQEISRASGLTLDQARAKAEATPSVSFFFYCKSGMDLTNYGKGTFSPGDAVFFSGAPWYGSAPQCDTYVLDQVPRNIAWIEDMPQNIAVHFNPNAKGGLTDHDFDFLTSSKYTHLIVCFFHFDPGTPPKLVYNGPHDANQPILQPLWDRYRGMRQGAEYKTMLLSMGGWGSGTWNAISGKEVTAAKILADFAKNEQFDGVDLNFEGPQSMRQDPTKLSSLAKFGIALRAELGDRILTFTPMVMPTRTPSGLDLTDNVVDQLHAIDTELGGHAGAWQDILTWVNPQFYSYSLDVANPEDNVPNLYDALLAILPGAPNVPPAKMTAGFPLEGAGAPNHDKFNGTELATATADVKKLYFHYGHEFGGAFAWRYKFTKGTSAAHAWDSKIRNAMS